MKRLSFTRHCDTMTGIWITRLSFVQIGDYLGTKYNERQFEAQKIDKGSVLKV